MAVEALEPGRLMAVDPYISEFAAINERLLLDEDRDDSDWIEIHNPNQEASALTEARFERINQRR
jgi:hypothetical protein